MKEKKKEDIETAEVVGKEETPPPRQLEPDWFKRLKDRMVYIYGILVLDFFVVFFAYGVYNSRGMKETGGLQQMFLVFYRITFIFGVMSTLGVIFDADHGSKVSFFMCYVVGIFCCVFVTVIPLLGYFFYTCYTTIVPWFASEVLGEYLVVIWNLTPVSLK